MTMNKDLQQERAQASFVVESMTNMLDGGKERTDRRRQLEKIIASDPSGVFSNDDNYNMHRVDRHVRALAKFVRLIEIARKLGIGNECDGHVIASKDWPILVKAIADDLPAQLHWVMFVPNIVSLCDEEQQAEWLPLCRDFRMIGCYAQTEIGHGSNVRALETTATFLPESQGGMKGGSWVVNSPTVTSTKAWPGTLGRTANHAMVIARLIDGEGVDRGIHNFLVPLRSMKDHTLLPGVTTGDLGPKIGFNVMDNGFASFKNVVIPRRNMAMRFATVDQNGKYTKKAVSGAASKIAYITMMLVRAFICDESGKSLAKACTINIRYSAVRRQGYAAGDKMERQILDYRQQQHRIFPLLASAYCFWFTGRKAVSRLDEIEARLLGNKAVAKEEVGDIHASLSGLKSFCTMVAADGMEDCRKACGGHGFLQSSGLPEMVTTYLQNPTVEGDNHMLPQQVLKVLLKLVQAIQTGSDLKCYSACDSGSLIEPIQSLFSGETPTCKASSEASMLEISVLLDAFVHRAARLVVAVAGRLQNAVGEGTSPDQAWNDCLIEIARASRAYSQFLLVRNFASGIAEQEASGSVGPAEGLVLTNLARLCALYWMEKEVGDFLEDGYMTPTQASWVRECVLKMLDKVRPDAVALVDAWDYSDFSLRSAIGRYDGDVYPAILAASRTSPLNQTEPGPGYNPHLKRLIVDGVGAYTGTASRL